MKVIQVFDKPMCCSTGVCGPDVDPELPRFAADLQWLEAQGHRVERFNLGQQPEAFARHPVVLERLASEGTSCLPLILVDGAVASRRIHPTREQWAAWMNELPIASTDCCGGPAKDASQACCAADEKTQGVSGVGQGCRETGCC